MLILDDTSPRALAVDRQLPPSAARLAAALCRAWPRIEGRITFEERPIEDVALTSDDLVVSAHACGYLTDVVIDKTLEAHCSVVVLPCCHDEAACDAGDLGGWMDASLAIDATRARRLAQHGYRVRTQLLPSTITPKNRLLMGAVGR
jgi:hypothetical protein